jgi:hypothetical protein
MPVHHNGALCSMKHGSWYHATSHLGSRAVVCVVACWLMKRCISVSVDMQVLYSVLLRLNGCQRWCVDVMLTLSERRCSFCL